MRRTTTLLLLLPLLLTAMPAHAQFTEGWTIVPAACHSCPAAWVCVLEMLNNLVTLIMTIAVLIVVLVITYAGILLVFTATNPENKSKAKSMLINAAVGLVIALGAWLIIDKVLESLGAGGIDETTRVIGTGGSACVVAQDPITEPPEGTDPSPITPGPGGGGSGANCPVPAASGMVAFPAEATSGETEYATPSTVENFLAMRAAALADGIDIKVTDGYRSEAEQVQLWYRYSQDTSQVARPCTLGGGGSNHNSGVALDLTVGCRKTNSSCDSAQYRWLKANGSRWGFNNNLPTDTVHWSPSGR